jgi:hypothetical protein
MIHENENVQFRRSRLSGGLYVLKLQLRSQWANQAGKRTDRATLAAEFPERPIRWNPAAAHWTGEIV